MVSATPPAPSELLVPQHWTRISPLGADMVPATPTAPSELLVCGHLLLLLQEAQAVLSVPSMTTSLGQKIEIVLWSSVGKSCLGVMC